MSAGYPTKTADDALREAIQLLHSLGFDSEADELECVHQEIAALKADAERYRWLRDKGLCVGGKYVFGRDIQEYVDGAMGKDGL